MRSTLAPVLAVAALSASAPAFEFRARWVERVGSTDTVIAGNITRVEPGTSHRFRLQFGVFDNASGAAPAGGFIGWNLGNIWIAGHVDNSVDRRTNGRIAPFTFATLPNSNGSPPPAGGVSSGDAVGTDFQQWTDIDATLGTQSPFWGFDEAGDPLPQPPPTVRGLNTYISVYEITTRPAIGATLYSISAAGNLLAASDWRTIGIPVPPDPNSLTPGTVTYAPFVLAPVSFDTELRIDPTPAPGSAMLILTGMLAAARRRR